MPKILNMKNTSGPSFDFQGTYKHSKDVELRVGVHMHFPTCGRDNQHLVFAWS